MENTVKKIEKEQFCSLLDNMKVPEYIDRDYTYEIYDSVIDGINELSSMHDLFSSLQTVNHFEVIQYIIGEFSYSVANRSKEEVEAFLKNEEYQQTMASVVADKYISLSSFAYKETKMTNKFIPPVSTLALYVNFVLNILNNYEQHDPKTTLLTDLLKKAASICKCSLELIVDGFETEAFSCWRTLHECECSLLLLEKYGDPLVDRYLKHMQFGIAFRDVMEDKEEQTRIFMSMKEEMKEYNLKSKDIKKYIEYGWAYGIPGVKEDETFKLNFRDGIEKIAGLSDYASRYEMSSEIIHGTPMLIYSNREYFHFITLLCLYESFFRLEKVFVSLFVSKSKPEVVQRYAQMRSLYYSQLVSIHKRESIMFNIWKQGKIKGNK